MLSRIWIRLACVVLLMPFVFGGITQDKDSGTRAHLERLSQAYRTAYFQLQETKQELVELRYRCTMDQLNNWAKTMINQLPGMVEYMVGLPGASDLIGDLCTELIVGDMPPKARYGIKMLAQKHAQRRERLSNLSNALLRAMELPLNRFDDDRGALAHAQEVWKEGDGKPDDNLELVTRRLNVLRFLSDKLIKEVEEEMQSLVADRREVVTALGQIRTAEASKPDSSRGREPYLSAFQSFYAAWEHSIACWAKYEDSTNDPDTDFDGTQALKRKAEAATEAYTLQQGKFYGTRWNEKYPALNHHDMVVDTLSRMKAQIDAWSGQETDEAQSGMSKLKTVYPSIQELANEYDLVYAELEALKKEQQEFEERFKMDRDMKNFAALSTGRQKKICLLHEEAYSLALEIKELLTGIIPFTFSF